MRNWQRSSSQMSAFVVEGKLLTDENDIRNTWVDHFEGLGTPSAVTSFDDECTNRISNQVGDILRLRLEDPFSELPTYEEFADVCSRLKLGVSCVSID